MASMISKTGTNAYKDKLNTQKVATQTGQAAGHQGDHLTPLVGKKVFLNTLVQYYKDNKFTETVAKLQRLPSFKYYRSIRGDSCSTPFYVT